MKLTKQVEPKGLLKRWGQFRFLFVRVQFYIALMNLVMIGLTTFNTTLQPWITNYIDIDAMLLLFIMAVAIFIFVIVMFLFEHKYSQPAIMKAQTTEMYKQSPNRIAHNEIKHDIELIKTKLGITE